MRKLSFTGVIAFAGMFACTLSITPASTQKRPDVRGIITHISRSESQKNILGRILIEGTKDSDTQVDKANLTITSETKFFVEHYGEREPATFDDLREGQRVEAFFTGPLRESYPVQANAGEITILSSNQSPVPLKQTWTGKDIPDQARQALTPSSYVADNASWTKLWRALRGSESLPQIDFAKELIVFCTTVSPNSCGINLSLDEQGDLKITSVSTLIGSDAKTFNYQIGSIDRQRVKSIAGKPIAAGAADSAAEIEIVARLKQATHSRDESRDFFN